MRNWRLTLVAAAAVVGLQACDQSGPVTTVQPPQASLPDDAALRGDPASQAATAPPADSLATGQAVAPPPADGSTTPPVAGGAAPPADGTQGSTSAMGAAGDPSATQSPAGMGSAAAGAPGGQGTAAMTEMWQAFPPGGAGAASPPPTAAPASPPAKVSSAELPRVRNPGDAQGADLLAQRPLVVPVAGMVPTALADNYEQSRGSGRHEAMDILAPAGTPVVAVDDGRIAKLFTSKPGGLTIYQFDPQAKLAYYYAHLQGYAQGLREGQDVRRGDLIGYVGSTGNADVKAPHLHFAVFRLGTPPKWWQGEPVNPYPALSRATPIQQFASR